MHLPTYDGWRVRVTSADGRLHGAGILVAPDVVLTCAHVAARAAQAAASGPCPASPIYVQITTADHLGIFQATISPEYWVPAAPDHTGDLALLLLDRPAPVKVAPLGTCGPPNRRTVRAFGHPRGDVLGRWATAIISGTAGPTNEWVQLNDPNPSGTRIEPGFSGAGVVDDSNGRVIGIVVGSDREAAARGAWMIAMEAVARQLPHLQNYLSQVELGPPTPVGVADPGRTDYERALVEELSALPGIGERSSRDELISELDRTLDVGLDFPRSDRPRTDLLHLVRACLEYPSENILGRLVAVVRAMAGDGPTILRLMELLSQDPGRGLSADAVQRLVALVAELPGDAVRDVAVRVLGPVGQTHDLDPHDLSQLIRALAQLIGEPDQLPPLLRFLRLLSELPAATGPARSALHGWLSHLAERWQVPLTSHRPARVETALPTPLRSSLVINLHEDGPNPDRYLLSIWLQHGTPHGLVGRGLMTHDDQPLTIDEIPGYIGTHLRRVVGGQLGPIGPLTIEFVVPYYLLNGSFDQFRIMLDGPQTLGSAHPLVLRSLDRLHRDVIHHRWRTRWLWLDTHQHEFDHRATKFINLQGTAVDDELQQHNDYSTEIPVCLVLAARGRGRADAALINAIKDSLDLGMPVVLWCRAPRLNQQFLAEMSNQLHGRPLVEIPAMVQRMRQLAARSDNSSEQVGANISLLWDEAVRLPLTDAFRAPPREDYQ